MTLLTENHQSASRKLSRVLFGCRGQSAIKHNNMPYPTEYRQSESTKLSRVVVGCGMSHFYGEMWRISVIRQSGLRTVAFSGCRPNLAKVVASAKSQFRDWCLAFREFVDVEDTEPSNNFVMRFVRADPIAFCLAVQQPNLPSGSHSTGLSDTWSGTPLVLDRDSIPAQFNTIDTSTLVDSIGCLNILRATVPVLQQSPSSTLTTESYDRPFSEETVLLKYFLCQQPVFMYAVFGVAPLAHLTAVSPTGPLQDTAALLDFVGERPAPVRTQIVCKSTWVADSNITHMPQILFEKPIDTPFQSRPSVPFDELLTILFQVSGVILSRGSEMAARANQYGAIYRRNYTAASFAAFVVFFKTLFVQCLCVS